MLTITPRTFVDNKLMTEAERAECGALPVAERENIIRSMLVSYPRFRDARQSIERFHRPVANGGTHSRGKVGAMLGESGAGKSFVLENYAGSMEDVVDENGRYKRAVYVNLIKGCTAHDLATAIYRALGFPHAPKVSTSTLTNMVERAVNEPRSRVELVIIDDAQYLLCASDRRHQNAALGIITGIAKGRRCNVLLGGTHEIASVVQTQAHTFSLGMLHRHYLLPYDWRIASELQHFLLLLYGIDLRLPFAKLSGLYTSAIAESLFQASGGVIGKIMSYVEAAALDAMNDGLDRITCKNWQIAAQDRQSPDQPSTLFQDVDDTFVELQIRQAEEARQRTIASVAGEDEPAPRPKERPLGAKKRTPRLTKTASADQPQTRLTKGRV